MNKKDYEYVWQDPAKGFGPPSTDMLTHCGQPQGRTIIDIASGNGRYALEFVRMGFASVAALDAATSSCRMIAEQSEVITVIHADICSYTVSDHYDVVFCSGLLAELDSREEQIAAVRVMQDMVLPGGLCVLRQSLFLSDYDPPERLEENLMPDLFAEALWDVTHLSADPTPFRNEKSRVSSNIIRRQTLVARKRL